MEVERAERQLLEDGATRLGLKLSRAQFDQLGDYAGLVAEWNPRVRLVGSAVPEVLVRKHLLDCLACVTWCLDAGRVHEDKRVADVGSGAGLPGIPLAIAVGCRVTLIEPVQKKARFLEEAVRGLRLENVRVACVRAEDAGRGPMRAEFDAAVTRAVASAAVVLEYCLPVVRVGGLVVAQKGRPDDQELSRMAAAAKDLGGSAPELIELDVAALVGGRRTLLVCRKESETPARFPRKSGTPRKRPLGHNA